jgi:hypothetical protein
LIFGWYTYASSFQRIYGKRTKQEGSQKAGELAVSGKSRGRIVRDTKLDFRREGRADEGGVEEEERERRGTTLSCRQPVITGVV